VVRQQRHPVAAANTMAGKHGGGALDPLQQLPIADVPSLIFDGDVCRVNLRAAPKQFADRGNAARQHGRGVLQSACHLPSTPNAIGRRVVADDWSETIRLRPIVIKPNFQRLFESEGSRMSDRYNAYTRLKIDYPSKRILRLTFDRPETYNSVDAETHTQLTHIWRDINDDPDINAVIVTGAGKAFSAGGDFELIKSILDNPSARMSTWKEAKDLVYNVINCNKPIISAINGVAVAAGDVACIIWPLLCGLAKAKYYLLTCKPLSGAEAERIGLVSLCVEDAEL